jgi:hypothetical protein
MLLLNHSLRMNYQKDLRDCTVNFQLKKYTPFSKISELNVLGSSRF